MPVTPRGEFNIAMANRIMTAVAAGERDLKALKRPHLAPCRQRLIETAQAGAMVFRARNSASRDRSHLH